MTRRSATVVCHVHLPGGHALLCIMRSDLIEWLILGDVQVIDLISTAFKEGLVFFGPSSWHICVLVWP